MFVTKYWKPNQQSRETWTVSSESEAKSLCAEMLLITFIPEIMHISHYSETN